MIRCFLDLEMIAHPPKHGSSGIACAIVDLHRPPNVPSGISKPMLGLPSAPVAPTLKTIVDLQRPPSVPFANSTPGPRLHWAIVAPTRKITLKTTLTTILHLTMIGTRASESLTEPLIRIGRTPTHTDRHPCLELVHQIHTRLLGHHESARRIRTQQLLDRHLLLVRQIPTRLLMTTMNLVGYQARTRRLRRPYGITIGSYQTP